MIGDFSDSVKQYKNPTQKLRIFKKLSTISYETIIFSQKPPCPVFFVFYKKTTGVFFNTHIKKHPVFNLLYIISHEITGIFCVFYQKDRYFSTFRIKPSPVCDGYNLKSKLYFCLATATSSKT